MLAFSSSSSSTHDAIKTKKHTYTTQLQPFLSLSFSFFSLLQMKNNKNLRITQSMHPPILLLHLRFVAFNAKHDTLSLPIFSLYLSFFLNCTYELTVPIAYFADKVISILFDSYQAFRIESDMKVHSAVLVLPSPSGVSREGGIRLQSIESPEK